MEARGRNHELSYRDKSCPRRRGTRNFRRNKQVARAYQPQIAPKWISDDGKSFWLVWTDFQFVGPQRPYYSYNIQKVELVSE